MAENNDFGMGYAMGQDAGGRNNGMFGGDGWWAIILFAMIFGWGNGGFGGWGNGGGGCDTRAAINEGFALNGIENGIRGVQQGLCDGFYAMNTGMLNGFNGVQMQMSNLAAQQQQCCCETQRLLEQNFGKTFSQKLADARMAAASQLLTGTDLSVTEIAERTGYSSIEHFSAAFHRLMGCTPRQYRRQHGN